MDIEKFYKYFIIFLVFFALFLFQVTKSWIIAIAIPLFLISVVSQIKNRKVLSQDITEDILLEWREKAGSDEAFRKILRKKITLYEANIIESKEKGIKTNQKWLDNLEILKKELNKIENKEINL